MNLWVNAGFMSSYILIVVINNIVCLLLIGQKLGHVINIYHPGSVFSITKMASNKHEKG